MKTVWHEVWTNKFPSINGMDDIDVYDAGHYLLEPIMSVIEAQVEEPIKEEIKSS